jgi:hypothetical protein
VSGALALLGVLATAAPSAPPAVGAPVAQATEAQPPEGWYGLPALISDVASSALLVSALGSNSDIRPKLLGLGFAGFALGGPLNHFDHGHGGRALGSLGLRVAAGAAAVGFVALAGARGCYGDTGAQSDCNLVIFSPVALVGAMIIDDAVIAYERPKPPDAQAHVSLTPSLSLAPHGGLFSLGGFF